MNGLRKFIITIYFGTAVFVLCWYDHMTGTQVVEAVAILAGLYKAANVIDKKLGGAG
jgi:hypothetical protein